MLNGRILCMPRNDSRLHVEVAYGYSGIAHIIPARVMPGATIREVIEHSGILQRCPEIDLGENKVGIFGTVLPLDDKVTDGDRIEIYRSLQVDPKEARRRRAEKQKAKHN